MEHIPGSTHPINEEPARADDLFTAEIEGLPEASPPRVIRLNDGDRLDLRITPVRKRIDDAELRMLGYNGSIPGPTLHVDQGSEITVQVTNDGDVEATVHWHGLRLENRYDGVPHETQSPIPIGGTFTYKVQFPDAGFYWYHPHIREDFGLEMGLYGTIIVEPSDPSYWPAVDRQLSITLDDLLVEDGHIAPFHRSGPNYTAMGRFGNVMLINGETTFSGEAAVGEVVRLYLVNTANTRIFNVALPGARMKLVGGDSGRYEREAFVDEVMLAPSERAVVDVMFDSPGDVRLEHRTPDQVYDLGAFSVAGNATGSAGGVVRRAARRSRADRRARIDRRLISSGRRTRCWPSWPRCHSSTGTTRRRRRPTPVPCIRRSRPRSREPARSAGCSCSRFVPSEPTDASLRVSDAPGGHVLRAGNVPEVRHEAGALRRAAGTALRKRLTTSTTTREQSDGLEWEDLMPEINRASDPGNMRWMLIDRETGAENGAITWAFTVGDRVKIRLVNEMESDHPMHHPFHVHGAGRFLVLSRDGEPEPNLVWKDTVLVRAGQTVDILLDVSNPGTVDGALPHRRARAERDDVQLRRCLGAILRR